MELWSQTNGIPTSFIVDLLLKKNNKLHLPTNNTIKGTKSYGNDFKK